MPFTEEELKPDDNWYARQKVKARMMRKPMREAEFSADIVCGYLSPIVFALNQGKTITKGSAEYYALKELLEKANQ